MSVPTHPGRRWWLKSAAASLFVTCATGIALSPAPSFAQKMVVGATVLKRATLDVLSQPTEVRISREDIARGYVDAPGGATVVLKTNSGPDVLLEFSNDADFVRAIRVHGLNVELQMGASGGFVKYAAATAARQVLDLRFRFELSQTAREGVYAWPVHVGVRPL